MNHGVYNFGYMSLFQKITIKFIFHIITRIYNFSPQFKEKKCSYFMQFTVYWVSLPQIYNQIFMTLILQKRKLYDM